MNAKKSRPGCVLVLLAIIGASWISVCRQSDDSSRQRSQRQDEKNSALNFDGSEAPEPAAPLRKDVIPGLSASDVYANFTKRGFSLETQFGDAGNFWFCKKATWSSMMQVEIMSLLGTKVSSVRATFTNTGLAETEADREAKEFLGFVASLPYDKANPSGSARWVQVHMGQNETMQESGGVTFELIASAQTRMLVITPTRQP